jgi:hypothetical protein
MGRRDRYEYADLAAYNSEVARGIVHTPEWDAKMAEDLRRFKETLAPGYDWNNAEPGDFIVTHGP